MPLIEVARTKSKPEALAALDEWKTRHADIGPALHPADVLVDGMRGSSSLWYRVRVNLQHVPEAERPPQEELIADYDPWAGKEWPGRPAS
jgi:bifunctional non-homologous end joining protein LigD